MFKMSRKSLVLGIASFILYLVNIQGETDARICEHNGCIGEPISKFKDAKKDSKGNYKTKVSINGVKLEGTIMVQKEKVCGLAVWSTGDVLNQKDEENLRHYLLGKYKKVKEEGASNYLLREGETDPEKTFHVFRRKEDNAFGLRHFDCELKRIWF